ncbi:hypothetical protein [Tropicimonas isoalkanivorans]|uniref:Lipoprotein n=1 Tax=Tropicimonas isoalkanivorans TaxID=441112 RepID=A0A1I1GQT5_9RHOB|nr:hypothetical protein [Tropicimonas isoalkanivorans]SFC11613.1 hypothetical protein SAMN04488094_102600 [Tropicimonas isoalkanivorans]
MPARLSIVPFASVILLLLAAACTDSPPPVSRSVALPEGGETFAPDALACAQTRAHTAKDTSPCEGTAAPPAQDGARLGAGDYADAGSSALAAASGLSELNPAYAAIGPAAPVAMLGLKYGGKAALIDMGLPAGDVNRVVEAVGMAGGCSNLSLVAGAAAPPALALGAVCGVLYNDAVAKRQARKDVRYLTFEDGDWVLEGQNSAKDRP